MKVKTKLTEALVEASSHPMLPTEHVNRIAAEVIMAAETGGGSAQLVRTVTPLLYTGTGKNKEWYNVNWSLIEEVMKKHFHSPHPTRDTVDHMHAFGRSGILLHDIYSFYRQNSNA
jgi:hypothetical protein